MSQASGHFRAILEPYKLLDTSVLCTSIINIVKNGLHSLELLDTVLVSLTDVIGHLVFVPLSQPAAQTSNEVEMKYHCSSYKKSNQKNANSKHFPRERLKDAPKNKKRFCCHLSKRYSDGSMCLSLS